METLNNLDPHWTWLAIGLFLAAAEMAIPGLFLIWLAGAAIITGFLTWMMPIGVPLQVFIFAALAMISVFTGKRYLRDHPITEVDPMLNHRGAQMVGQIVLVTQAIESGGGRVRHGDSEWLARGADAPAGSKVRITGSDGSTLLVEPV